MYGYPNVIKSDNGSPFNSSAFKTIARHSGFKHRRITPLWPRANAQAKSFNKPLMKAVRYAHVENKNWKQEMYQFLRQYRATPHPTTGFSPYRLLFGRNAKSKLPQVDTKHSNPVVDCQARLKDTIAKDKMKIYADKRNQAQHCDLDIGDKFLVRFDKRENKPAPPIQPESSLNNSQKGKYDNS